MWLNRYVMGFARGVPPSLGEVRYQTNRSLFYTSPTLLMGFGTVGPVALLDPHSSIPLVVFVPYSVACLTLSRGRFGAVSRSQETSLRPPLTESDPKGIARDY